MFGVDEQTLLAPVPYAVDVTVGDDNRVVVHDELEGAAWLALCTVQVALNACGEHLLGVEHHVRIHALDGRVDDVIDRVHLLDAEQVAAALVVIQQAADLVDVLDAHQLLRLFGK